MEEITWNDFKRIQLVVGTVTSAQEFPEAKQPAYIIHADFGSAFGILKSSAQVTDRYLPEDLIGRQIIGVLNFPPKQIGPIKSQFLVTGFTCEDGTVVLAQPDQQVRNGLQLE
ncbi:MAG: tRNA-binding protein [Acidiferrobacteraceae bacterium]|nr:tRNA-binding protein [Acidiferrobacteraceae bacterium]